MAQLSTAQLESYDRDGYVVVAELLSGQTVEALTRAYWAIADGEHAPPPSMLVMRDVMVAKGQVTPASKRDGIAKIQDIQDEPIFWDRYMCEPALLDLVESICGPDIKAIHSMLINKPPGVDGRHPLHQDLLYFPFRPESAIVATWTALDRCTRDNGTLSIVPGSHHRGLLEHETPPLPGLNHGYFGAKGVGDGTERVHLTLAPGDTVLFHPLLLHGSGHNVSGRSRLAIRAHCASAACSYLPHGKQVAAFRHYRLVRGREHEAGI